MKVIAATTNKGKLKEIKRILEPAGIEVIEPEEKIEVKEDGLTFLENAYKKAEAYYKKYKLPALADDSGLVVYSLNGYPGVFSSRFYSIEWGGKEDIKEGENKDKANIRKLLRLLKDKKDRRAEFVACIVLYTEKGGLFSFGKCKGIIVESPRGDKGFGYDPVFQPEGYTKTMAELEPEEKDRISHRGKALRNLVELIKGVPENCKLGAKKVQMIRFYSSQAQP